jgi:hypothetical protein
MRLTSTTVTEKDIRRVLLRHPWLSLEYARRIAEDQQRMKANTVEGRRTYQREYMRLRRAELKGEVTDVPGVVAGKYLEKKVKAAKTLNR